MQGLMLHCGAETVSADDLKHVELPEQRGRFYPISHDVMVKEVKERIQMNGYEITDEAHGLGDGGVKYFGVLGLRGGLDHPDYQTTIGLQNILDGKHSWRMGIGSHVFVCDNTAFSVELEVRRRHTRNAWNDIPGKVQQALNGVGNHEKFQALRIDSYKNTDADNATVNDILVESAKKGIIGFSQIKHVLDEWLNPSHDEFKGRDLWSLMNAYTEYMKNLNVFTVPKRTQDLHILLDGFSSVTPEMVQEPEYAEVLS